jgi:outer membrane protein assembly factor BamA
MNFMLVIFTLLLPVFFNLRAAAQPDETPVDSLSTIENDSLKSSLTILPAVFYTPETRLGFGVYPNYIFRFSEDGNPSYLSFLAYYTIKKQISISFDPSLYISNDDYILSGTAYFTKWPDQFFGFGTGVSKDSSEDYTVRNSGIYLEFKRKTIDRLYAGVACELAYTKFLELKEDGRPVTEGVTGVDGGLVSGAGLAVSWDGRDKIFFPGRGEYLSANTMYYGSDLGGDYAYNRLIVDLRKYHALYNNIIAMQIYGSFVKGNAPFREYSQIGEVVRGYLPALYTEKKLVAAQIEYRRVPLLGRFGITLFAGAGTVARTISDLHDARLKFAAGLGLRYILVKAEKFNIRIDYGIGDGTAEFYLAAGEAF